MNATEKKFQVIGGCSRMQRQSLDEEIKLMDGVPYDLDFSMDFSNVCWNNTPLSDIPVNSLASTILFPVKEPDAIPASCSVVGESESHQYLLEALEEEERRNRKALKKEKKKMKKEKKKWKKEKIKHPKNKHYKTFEDYKNFMAEKNFRRVVERLTGEKF